MENNKNTQKNRRHHTLGTSNVPEISGLDILDYLRAQHAPAPDRARNLLSPR